MFAIEIGTFRFALRWYALAYIAGLLAGWWLIVQAVKRPALWPGDTPPMQPAQVEGLLTAVVLGVILGGRLGFVLFYQPGYYLQNPAEILQIWQGGMSFHGGLIGVAVAAFIFCRMNKAPPLQVADATVHAWWPSGHGPQRGWSKLSSTPELLGVVPSGPALKKMARDLSRPPRSLGIAPVDPSGSVATELVKPEVPVVPPPPRSFLPDAGRLKASLMGPADPLCGSLWPAPAGLKTPGALTRNVFTIYGPRPFSCEREIRAARPDAHNSCRARPTGHRLSIQAPVALGRF